MLEADRSSDLRFFFPQPAADMRQRCMCRGLTSPGARLDDDFQAGDFVALMCEGQEHALAIGVAIMSRDVIRSKNTGIGIEMINFLGDGLWLAQKI